MRKEKSTASGRGCLCTFPHLVRKKAARRHLSPSLKSPARRCLSPNLKSPARRRLSPNLKSLPLFIWKTVGRLALILTMLLLPLGGSSAFAEEPEGGCSLTLLLGEGADHLENPLQGGSIALYLVATAHLSEERYYDIAGGQFSEVKSLANLRTLSKEELDAANAALAEELLAYARTRGISPRQMEAIRDGRVRFGGLSAGLYLLAQAEDAAGGRRIRAFLISVPDEAGEVDVVAAPKPGIFAPTGTPTPTPTTPPDIPQTGQLWWPVPVLLFLGAGLLAFGVALGRKTDKT